MLYQVNLIYTASHSLSVTADTFEQACLKALSELPPAGEFTISRAYINRHPTLPDTTFEMSYKLHKSFVVEAESDTLAVQTAQALAMSCKKGALTNLEYRACQCCPIYHTAEALEVLEEHGVLIG